MSTGRGLVSSSSGDVVLQSSAVLNCEWHGIVIFPPIPVYPKSYIKDCFIGNPGGAAIYFDGTYGIVSGGDVAGGEEGGIVCYESDLIVVNSHIHDNYKYGIFLLWTKNIAVISNNVIERTHPDLFSLRFGDGITMALSAVNMWNNDILDSARAGIANFGSYAALGNNRIQCAGYEIEGEEFLQQNYVFQDDSGNLCGCPNATGSCIVETAGVQPPEPSAPIK